MTTPRHNRRSSTGARSRDEAVAQYLHALRTTGKVGWADLERIAVALARILPRLGPVHARVAAGVREGLVPPRAATTSNESVWVLRRTILFLFDACARGEVNAINAALSDLALAPELEPGLGAMADFLDHVGIARGLGEKGLAKIRAFLATLPAERIDLRRTALSLVGMSLASPLQVRQAAFERLACPLLEDAAKAQDVQTALELEAHIYERYLKSVEAPGHHRRTFAAIERAMELLGPKARRERPRKERPEDPPRVAFVIQNGAMLAHTEVLLSFLRGLRGLETAPLEPLVLIFFDIARQGNGGPLGVELDRLGVRWHCPRLEGAVHYESHFDECRGWLAAAGVDAAVFVSLPLHLAYFMQAPLAPVQIWWSMKFALPNFPALDGRVFFRWLFPRTAIIEGRTWHCGPIAISPPPAPDPNDARVLRARFGSKMVIGTIAREEKIANREYLDAICRLLKRHPEACFVWTGRRQLKVIDDCFEQAGVAGRCHFVGWVDPALYIEVFDLFVETYPLSGLMAAWSMAMGKPVVSVGSSGILGTYLESVFDGSVPVEAHEKAMLDSIFAPLQGRLPALWATTPEGIDAIADLLIKDPQLAADVGAAQQRFIRAFLSDEKSSAENNARMFVDIARQNMPP